MSKLSIMNRHVSFILVRVVVVVIVFSIVASASAYGVVEEGVPAAEVLTTEAHLLEWIPGELVVEFKPNVSRSESARLIAQHNAITRHEVPQIRMFVLGVDEGTSDVIASALSRHPSVARVSKNFLFEPALIPNDSAYTSQWHHAKIGSPTGWDIDTGGTEQIIAILDSGIDTDHPDLAAKLLPSWDFYYNDSDYEDICGHGTQVAGTAAAISNNNLGVAGVAWGPKILPLKITSDTTCYGSYSAMASALVYAADQGARIANISYAIYDGTVLNTSLSYFRSKGGLVFAAGGNSGAQLSSPDNPYLISVSATDIDDGIVSFSTSGPYIDLSAPGVNIYTTRKGGLYGFTSGTSFSSPITAGIGALIMAANPTLSPIEVEAILEETARDLGASSFDSQYGWGRVNAAAALHRAAGEPLPDTAYIVKAGYHAAKGELTVEAVSSQGGTNTVLTVEGFGTMKYNSRKDVYQLKVPGIDYIKTVTIFSSLGGMDIANVVKKSGKRRGLVIIR